VHRDLDAASVEIAIFIWVKRLYLLSSLQCDAYGVMISSDHALEAARMRRDEACGPGHGKSVACQARRVEVTKLDSGRA
jgi:hypothetical protein